MTKLMAVPVEKLKQRVQQLLAGNAGDDQLKFMIYSGHDDQVSNLMVWLNPVGYDMIDVPYAATVTFELHYDNDCLKATKDESCFTVHVLHQGNPLKLQTCLDANKKRGSPSPICSYQDFMTHLQSISYQGDVYKACKQPFTPPSSLPQDEDKPSFL